MAWEDDLENDTPRGLTGREDQVPAARWADPTELGAEWKYHPGPCCSGSEMGAP